MPIPSRKQGQSEETFIGDCISNLIDEYTKEQAAAICYQQLNVQLTGDKDWRKQFMSKPKPEYTCLTHYTNTGLSTDNGNK